MWTLDHFFIATSRADKVERELAAFGLTFSERRVHAGQGTANACAVFENSFLEILRPADVGELKSDLVRPLGLDERIRWRETGACPFGVCFRPTGGDAAPDAWPFATWEYRPPGKTAVDALQIVTPVGGLTEPLLFVRGVADVASRFTSRSKPHRGSRRVLTRVTVGGPTNFMAASFGVSWFAMHDGFVMKAARNYELEMEWDHGQEGRSVELDGDVPIVWRW